ncbi:hypothetical protein ANCDUO_09585 [Ancylostoma duodenale]|uniref:Uncharacterized protein n=1 Tax=Ancylostoma duodenale TaxID=51022 RepID=A0A0C2GMD9_9BILA|nr:hypothetical protein ANCDUO_09585 [Ancylostoma duodenale]
MNDSVSKINTEIRNQLPGPAVIYASIDTVVDMEQAVYFPTEFLNSLKPPGMPPHRFTNGVRLCLFMCFWVVIFTHIRKSLQVMYQAKPGTAATHI